MGEGPGGAGRSGAGEQGGGVGGAGDWGGVPAAPASTTRRASPGGSPDHGPLNAGVLELGDHRDVASLENPEPVTGQEGAPDVADENRRAPGPGPLGEPEHPLGERPGAPDITGQHPLGAFSVAVQDVADAGRH